MAKLFDDGYAVLETNHVAAVRTGEIKAQYPMAAESADPENGMLLVVDDITKEVSFPAAAADYVHLHASEERLYEYHLGRKAFKLDAETQIPKMLKLNVGDIFETNAVDDGDFADLDAVIADLDEEDPVYGIPHTSGRIELKDDEAFDMDDYAVVLEVVEVVTLPNEHTGLKFVVKKA